MKDIERLQLFLNRIEFDAGIVDGQKGPRTISALQSFLVAYGLNYLPNNYDIDRKYINVVRNEIAETPCGPKDRTRITSQFGSRTHPVTGRKGTFHSGVDLRTFYASRPYDAMVYAPTDAVVTAAVYPNSTATNNSYITIKSLTTNYMFHNVHVNPLYRVGDVVAKGEVIAIADKLYGTSTGLHLHFEIFLDGRRVDPESVLRAWGIEEFSTANAASRYVGPSRPRRER